MTRYVRIRLPKISKKRFRMLSEAELFSLEPEIDIKSVLDGRHFSPVLLAVAIARHLLMKNFSSFSSQKYVGITCAIGE